MSSRHDRAERAADIFHSVVLVVVLSLCFWNGYIIGRDGVAEEARRYIYDECKNQ